MSYLSEKLIFQYAGCDSTLEIQTKIEVELSLSHHIKIKSRWIKNLIVNIEIIKYYKKTWADNFIISVGRSLSNRHVRNF